MYKVGQKTNIKRIFLLNFRCRETAELLHSSDEENMALTSVIVQAQDGKLLEELESKVEHTKLLTVNDVIYSEFNQ